jgi:hypothetical protein
MLRLPVGIMEVAVSSRGTGGAYDFTHKGRPDEKRRIEGPKTWLFLQRRCFLFFFTSRTPPVYLEAG